MTYCAKNLKGFMYRITSNIRRTFFTFFLLKIEMRLKFEELSTSLQTVHGVVWKERNVNMFGVSQ
jgi:hypothetical protein